MSKHRPALAVRDAVAAAILAALDDRAGADTLTALRELFERGTAPLPASLAAELLDAGIITPPIDAATVTHASMRAAMEPHGAAAAERLRRADDAIHRFRATRDTSDGSRIAIAFAQAAALWDAGLFFEVHEVLERLWRDVDGETRRFVQGVIQVAAALHHVETGNRDGARALRASGRAKLPTAGMPPGVDVALQLRGIDAWQAAEQGGAALGDLPPPCLSRARRAG